MAVATPDEREAIYRLRHEVYACELHQHAENDAGRLTDDVDGHNEFFAATIDGELAGCISVTPPGTGRFSVDKYVRREELPFPCDEGLYEVRLFTVAPRHRGSLVASLLFYSALRWVESRGGRRIVAVGRREILDLYRHAGLQPLGREVKSGAVYFELMTADVGELRRRLTRFRRTIERIESSVDWALPIPFSSPEPCEHGGAFWDAIGDEFRSLGRGAEVINADVLDAWFPPSPAILEPLGRHLSWLARTSPPTGCEGMVCAIARARGVDPRSVLPGDGSSALIYLALREWLEPSSRALILDPTYGEYAHLLEKVVKCSVERLELSSDDGFRVDGARLAERLEQSYDIVILVNPNSPTGRHMPRAELEGVLSAAPRRTRFWIDETYLEYADPGASLERFAAASENVVVAKSLSKVYALSGLRAAYLCAPIRLVDELRALTPPWAVSLPAQVAAVAALGDTEYYAQKWAQTRELREELARDLAATFRFRVFPSDANFLLCELPPGAPPAAALCDRCRGRGLFLRDQSSACRRLGDRFVRIAVKDRGTNRSMVEIIAAALSSAASSA
jgi:histidinol-phosphate/aromatic aminotransferase/cobyric acid decarboxylase-like protein